LANGQADAAPCVVEPPSGDAELPAGARPIAAHVPGSVWKVLVEPAQYVEAGQALVIIESMKMELTVSAPSAGEVTRVMCREGQSVSAGQVLVALAS
jgi:urea carboxylase